ncbi:MAG: hypothetical protein HKN26_05340 [Acidimicrobiales bacterium]|nr:hypothetical protein [Acidimicrobiales bacterium]
MSRFPRVGALAFCALLSTACDVHIVGDSTAALVQVAAQSFEGIVMTGSAEPSCGYGHMAGGRIQPSGGAITPDCVLDHLANSPDSVDDVVVAFLSVHDARCSVTNGCEPINTAVYVQAHADLLAYGNPVVWVEVPPSGDAAQQARIEDLNSSVAAALGCTLQEFDTRVAEMYDGIHYTLSGGTTVAARLAQLDAVGIACP